MFYRYKLDPNDNLHMDFINLLKKALGLLGAKKKLVDLVCIDKKTDHIEDLIDKYEKNIQISSAINHSTFLPKFAFQPPVAVPINITYSNRTHSQSLDKKLDQLIRTIPRPCFISPYTV